MRTIYISIPISGYDIEQQKKHAEESSEHLRNFFDCKVVTPFDLNTDTDRTDGYYMGRDIEHIIDHVDSVYFCRGWHLSKGCQTEYAVAKIYGKEILFE